MPWRPSEVGFFETGDAMGVFLGEKMLGWQIFLVNREVASSKMSFLGDEKWFLLFLSFNGDVASSKPT